VSSFLRHLADGRRAGAAAAAAREPLAAIGRRALDTAPPPPLRNGHAFGLIAEYKRRSPSLGALAGGEGSALRRVESYARGGAVAVSVLTEPDRFEGSLVQLAECADRLAPLGVPVMRKDFIVDEYQVVEARAAGAGGLLLIARLLGGGALEELVGCARSLGLFVLLECFDAADLARAARLAREGAVLLGVNARDLDSLAVDPARLAALAPLLPPGLSHVAESGLATPADCAAAARVGYRMALVGGALMTTADPEGAVRDMLAAGRAAA
jgi:indole-3-glycerol phosphate synthase